MCRRTWSIWEGFPQLTRFFAVGERMAWGWAFPPNAELRKRPLAKNVRGRLESALPIFLRDCMIGLLA